MAYIKQRHEYLFENIQTSKLDDVYKIVNNQLTKTFGPIGTFPSEIEVKKENGEKLRGKLFIIIDGNRGIRFNWKSGDKYSFIVSVDLWKKVTYLNGLNNPDKTIDLGGSSVVNALNMIEKYFNNNISELHDPNMKDAPKEKSEVISIMDLDEKEFENTSLDLFELLKYKVYQIANKYSKTYSLIITGISGVGKCHTKGTEIRMFDGSVKKVEDINIGDLLMGDDSTPRKVLNTNTGEDELYNIKPVSRGFDEFGCNSEHILSFKHLKTKEVVNVSIKEYLTWSNSKQNLHKLYRKKIQYPAQEISLDPYFLGIWLGDGNSHNAQIESMDEEIINYLYDYKDKLNETNNLPLKVTKYNNKESRSNGYKITNGIHGYSEGNYILNTLNELKVINNKHIPDIYMYNTEDIRKKLLAGIIDSDGYQFHKCYEISSKHKHFSFQIKYLANSLGLSSFVKEKIINDKVYYIIRISGDLSEYPILLERKKSEPRNQVKDVRNTGFIIEELGIGKYYGFTLDNNHLYCLKDYTITHNSYDTAQALKEMRADYKSITGSVTTAGLYDLLYRYHDQLILIDDADSVLKSENSVNMLKGALDSSEVRVVSNEVATNFQTDGMTMNDIIANTSGDISKADNPNLFKAKNKGRMPKNFYFTGKIIFISNLDGKDFNSALITRASAHIDVQMTHNEILDRMKLVMKSIHPNVDYDKKVEVLNLIDFLTSTYETRYPLSIRFLYNAIDTMNSNQMLTTINGKKLPMWQIMIKQDMLPPIPIKRVSKTKK